MLLHGLGASHQIWSLTVAGLALRRRVVTLDLPGFGASAPPRGPGYDLGAVTDRITRALAARGLRGPLDVVGHSLGGAVALTWAARHPGLIRRLVLVAPAGLHGRTRVPAALLGAGAEGLFALRRGLAPLTDLAWGRRALLAFAAADGGRLTPAQARMMVRASAGAERIAPAMAAIARADLVALAEAHRGPLGLIWGERDRAVPRALADVLTAARPDAELALLPAAGHVPMMERPAAFTAVLERVLRRLDKHATT